MLNRGICNEWTKEKPPLLRFAADARKVVKIAKHNIQQNVTQFVNPDATIFASTARRFRREQSKEKRFVKTKVLCGLAVIATLSLFGGEGANAQAKLIAKGTLTESSAGLFAF